MDKLAEYQTTDVAMAAYLVCNGHAVRIEAQGQKGTFYFEHVPKQHVMDYNSLQARVEPNEFASKMRQLIGSVRRVIRDGKLFGDS